MPRAEAAAVELDLLLNHRESEDRRIAAATSLEMGLWKDGDASDPINRKILGGFLNALIGAPEELQSALVSIVLNVVVTNTPERTQAASEYRASLRRAVYISSPAAMIEIIREHAHRAETDEEKHDLVRLADWIQGR
jgi:hypothetical protein